MISVRSNLVNVRSRGCGVYKSTLESKDSRTTMIQHSYIACPNFALLRIYLVYGNRTALKTIALKKGAQVMLTKNYDDTLVNSSLGKDEW